MGDAVTWLFVPGSRPDRFDRAVASGADEVVLDLQDAVAPGAKDAARDAVASWLRGGGAAWVRVNGVATREHEHDLAALGGCAGLRGVVVPDAEDPVSLQAVRAAVPDGAGVVALVESARGVDQVGAIARSGVDRLAFGSIDFALDIG
ncbi:MAG: citrate lyase subunit beta-like protein, partial [Marmoricola sp.]|nr:citrate lyase subunit beta-like protein [Marmoricola sp.]